jgi:hypothetical protein
MNITDVQREPVYTIQFTESELIEIMNSIKSTVDWKPAMHMFHELIIQTRAPSAKDF